eukprot:757521-Amphidinium_carterae.2
MRELPPGPEEATNAACHPQQPGTVCSRQACQPSSKVSQYFASETLQECFDTFKNVVRHQERG